MKIVIVNADGIILGSHTYASNVSGQMKTIIDRGHFVIEQLLYGKYAISVTTYENYGGKSSAQILNRLLSYSGAKISGTIAYRKKYDSNLSEDLQLKKHTKKIIDRFYQDIKKRRNYILQDAKHSIIFQLGIKPFVIKKGIQYQGVINHWRNKNII